MNGDDRTVFVNVDKEMPTGYGMEQEEILMMPENETVSELDQLYMELGKAYYEGGYEDPLPQLLPLFDKITKMKNPPKAKAVVCPNCGAKLEENARFCGNCGYRVL